MINLLPPQTKQEFTFARRNTQLVRWSLGVFIGIVGIGVVIGFGQIYIASATNNYTQQAEAARAGLKSQKLDETQQQVSDITSSLKLVVQVLSRQILFSKMIQQVGSVIPSGAAMTDLRLDKLQGGTDFQFVTTDYQTATQVQVNLQDPTNKIFDKVDIISINCTAGSATDLKYPCQITVRASFTKNNPFLFISPSTATGVKS